MIRPSILPPQLSAKQSRTRSVGRELVSEEDRSIVSPDHRHNEDGVEKREQSYLYESGNERLDPAEYRSISTPDHFHNEAPENQR